MRKDSTTRRAVISALGFAAPLAIAGAAGAASLMPNPPGTSVNRAAWETALANFRALWRDVEASDFGDTEETENAFHGLVSAMTDAADDLIETDAPDIAALADKLDVIITSHAAGDIGRDVIEVLLADARRLAIGGAA